MAHFFLLPSPIMTSTASQSSFDPRWRAPYLFECIPVQDTIVLLEHYRRTSHYWQDAYLKSQAEVSSLRKNLSKLEVEIESTSHVHDEKETNVSPLKSILGLSLIDFIEKWHTLACEGRCNRYWESKNPTCNGS
jgi:hypothetical protein